LALKILVDCSGSMQGESISQAQEAVYELSFTLGPDDAISYSKFGSTVVHTSKGLERCSPNYLKNVLARAILKRMPILVALSCKMRSRQLST